MINELEAVIKKTAVDYHCRKDYTSLALVIIPNGKTPRESIFHVEVVSSLIECHLHEPFKVNHVEFLKQKGYLKRKNTSVIKFDSMAHFSTFLEEILSK